MIVIARLRAGRGTNFHGQLGAGLADQLTTPAPLAALGEGIADAYRGRYHAVLLKRGA
jgi:hypothetical protein